MKYDVIKRIQVRDPLTREVKFYNPGSVCDIPKDVVLEKEGFIKPHKEKEKSGKK
jgi:hypothetical protein